MIRTAPSPVGEVVELKTARQLTHPAILRAQEVNADGRPGARIGDGQTVIGSTESVMEFLGLSPQHNEHCKGWRWHLYMQDNDKRMEAVREEARKIIAERRTAEDLLDEIQLVMAAAE